MIKEALSKLARHENLLAEEAATVMEEIMADQVTPIQTGAFLTALRMKGETSDEVSSFAMVMRRHCIKIHPNISGRLIDTCGTGGDAVKSFNVSTSAAFVAVGAGAYVAKHGNRSVTSKSGSADLLEALGVKIDLAPEQIERLIEEAGIGFLFAPNFHPAMRHAVQARKEIGIRTVFNILGPLTNPASASGQLAGVYAEELVDLVAKVMHRLGVEEAMIVHGVDGLDELSTVGATKVARVKDGTIQTTYMKPEDFGIKRVKPEEIAGDAPEGSAEITFRLLNGYENGARRDLLLLNSAAALIVAGLSEDFPSAIGLAGEAVESGRAYEKLKLLVQRSGGDLTKLEELEAKYA